MSLTRINEFIPAEGQAEALHSFLKALVPYISGCRGCAGVEVLRAEDDETCVVLERWESKEAHAASLANFPKEEMRAGMDLMGGPPQGRFFSSE